MAEPLTPVVNDLSRPFWEAAVEGRLCLPFCVASGQAFWPPSPSSPFVQGGPVEWRDEPGDGVLLSCAIYRRAFQKAFAACLPYAIGLVEILPNLRLQAHLSDPDAATAPRVGDRVRIAFRPLVEGGPPVPVIVEPA